MAHYIAITIGPIYKTFSLARKTREFWGASILFSLYAKKLCEELLKNGVTKDDFLVPHKTVLDHDMINIGLYLDRIIVKATVSLWNVFEEKIVNEAIKSLCDEIRYVCPGIDENKLRTFIKTYAVFSESNDSKPLEVLYEKLNALELYNIEISSGNIDNDIRNFLQNVNSEYDDTNSIHENSFLKKYFHISDLNGQHRIPSIVEISTTELKGKDGYKDIMNRNIWKEQPNENNLFTELHKKFEQDVKNCHKYICILQADGDKLGRKLMGSDKITISNISGDLTAWGKEALEILKVYGALPIFIGGDDLLCFAPVKNGDQSILQLAKNLNESYTKKDKLKGTSLSIGISISYYKSPMYASYISTFDLLKKAKVKGNSCCISYEKHSGSPHHFEFSFTEDYEDQIEPLVQCMNFNEKEKSFLSSVMYKLRKNEELFYLISNYIERIWYFFENNFDEANKRKEGTDKYKYLKIVARVLFEQFKIYGNKKDANNDQYIATTNVYSLIKTIRFIKGLDDDKQ